MTTPQGKGEWETLVCAQEEEDAVSTIRGECTSAAQARTGFLPPEGSAATQPVLLQVAGHRQQLLCIVSVSPELGAGGWTAS